jgi:hypothetical protein
MKEIKKLNVITDKLILKELKTAYEEIEECFEFVGENSPADYAIAVPYCTIHNLIEAVKVRIEVLK